MGVVVFKCGDELIYVSYECMNELNAYKLCVHSRVILNCEFRETADTNYLAFSPVNIYRVCRRRKGAVIHKRDS